jgi:hypothetical protein
MRNSVDITVNGQDYVVRELSVRQLFPLMELLQGGTMEGQVEVFGLSVHEAGSTTPIGAEAANELGMSTFMALLPVIMRVNGLEQNDEGNGSPTSSSVSST